MNNAATSEVGQQTEGAVLGAEPTIDFSESRLTFSSTEKLLRYLYEDLTRMSQVVSADIVLHRSDRDLLSSGESTVRGVDAVRTHIEHLVAATYGTLRMEVESISANMHFGVVLGTLHAAADSTGHDDVDAQHNTMLDVLEVPFCGVWRFVNGVAVEHWENVADPVRLSQWVKRAG